MQERSDGWIEKTVDAILYWSAVGFLFLFLAAILFVIAAIYPVTKARAVEYPFRIPAACQALARQYGIPNTIKNQDEADKALARIAGADLNSPAVQRCIAAATQENKK